MIEQGNKRLVIHKEPPPKKKTHWMLFLGLGMVVAVFVFIGLSQLSNWWNNHQLDATYGYPRTANMTSESFRRYPNAIAFYRHQSEWAY